MVILTRFSTFLPFLKVWERVRLFMPATVPLIAAVGYGHRPDTGRSPAVSILLILLIPFSHAILLACLKSVIPLQGLKGLAPDSARAGAARIMFLYPSGALHEISGRASSYRL